MFDTPGSKRKADDDNVGQADDSSRQLGIMEVCHDGTEESWEDYAFTGVEKVNLMALNEKRDEEERTCYDEDTGVVLPKDLVEKAEKEELEEYRKFNAYVEDDDENCVKITGKRPVGARFRTINKGDEKDLTCEQDWWHNKLESQA